MVPSALRPEAPSEEKLAVKLVKVKVRLEADAPKMWQMGAALIAHYLDPDRLPADKRWSRKHAHTQERLCTRSAAGRALPAPVVLVAGESVLWVDPAEIPSVGDVAGLGRARHHRPSWTGTQHGGASKACV